MLSFTDQISAHVKTDTLQTALTNSDVFQNVIIKLLIVNYDIIDFIHQVTRTVSMAFALVQTYAFVIKDLSKIVR